MRYILFLLSLTALYAGAMQKSVEKDLLLGKHPTLWERSKLSEDLYLALLKKRDFLEGSPEAHRNIKTKLNWAQKIAGNHGLADNYRFFGMVIDRGLVKVSFEFDTIVNHARKPSTDPQKKASILAAYDLLSNITNFFTEDLEFSVSERPSSVCLSLNLTALFFK